jgi:hypothetical protein
MRRRNLISGLLAVGFMGPAHVQQSGKVRRIVHPSHPVPELAESDSPAVRAIFSEVYRLGYVEGKNLLIERYSGKGRTADNRADEVVVGNPDLIIAFPANLTGCFQGGNHRNSASALGRSSADQILKRGKPWRNSRLPDCEIRTCQSQGWKAPGPKMPLELLTVAEEMIK